MSNIINYVKANPYLVVLAFTTLTLGITTIGLAIKVQKKNKNKRGK